jgi:threonine-phosphate decarboxylase
VRAPPKADALPARALPVHGGDRDAAAARYGVEPSTLLDLSANINPLGPPAPLVAALAEAARDTAALQRYPEPTYHELRARIAAGLRVDPASIVVGNGAAALLEATLAEPRATRCAFPVPAFSEYSRALAALRIEAVPVPLDTASDFALNADAFVEAVRRSGAEVALLNNPHNPSGALAERARILELADALGAEGCRTIVDEAFIDYVPHESIAREAARSETLTCVRSLTKFFAVPALRVGYAVCSPGRAATLRAQLPSWPVTTLAALAVAAAIDDGDFARRSRSRNAIERTWLDERLRGLGVRVPRSAANFVLVELPEPLHSAPVTARLAREHGVLVRDCTSYAGLAGEWIRIAIRTRAESERVVAALGSILRADR